MFVVIGIILVVALVLVFFLRDQLTAAIRQTPTNNQEYLSGQLEDIQNEVGRCVNSETQNGIKLLIKNGGNFERNTSYINYLNINYPVMCSEFENSKGCLAQMFLISDLKTKLENDLPNKINKCLELDSFRNKDYDFTEGETSLNIEILDDHLIINLNKLFELNRSSVVVRDEDFTYKIDAPLGDLVAGANKLIQTKASGEEINPALFSILTQNKYRLHVEKSYPDELYDLSVNGNDNYHLYFAILNNGRYERAEGRLK